LIVLKKMILFDGPQWHDGGLAFCPFWCFLFICCNKSVRDQFWPKTLSLNF